MTSARREIRPNFFYIGAPKSASSYIWQIFKEHPDIFVPEAKNTRYFDDHYAFGHEWFLRHFRSAKQERRVGEVSEWYLFSKTAIDRLKEKYPEAKVIVCLREPLEYLKSLFLQDLTDFKYLPHFEASTHNLEYFSKIPGVRRCLDFYESLSHVYNTFPEDNIHVTFIEDLRENAERFVKRLFTFLEVDADFKPKSLDRVVNPTTRSRSPLLALLLFRAVSPIVWRMGLGNFGTKVLRTRLVERVLVSSIPSEEKESLYKMSSANMHELGVQLHLRDQELEQILQRRLPDSWYQYTT